MSDVTAARETYAKLHANNSGPHCQGQTSQEAQAALDEVDALRSVVAAARGVVAARTMNTSYVLASYLNELESALSRLPGDLQ